MYNKRFIIFSFGTAVDPNRYNEINLIGNHIDSIIFLHPKSTMYSYYSNYRVYDTIKQYYNTTILCTCIILQRYV